jgi:cardiolipin synthase
MSPTNYRLFTDVSCFYENLMAALQQAEHRIDMIYFAFDHGEWADRISEVLRQKASDGLAVRLMVDELGLVVDHLENGWRNHTLLASLQAAGVQVDLFRPDGNRLSQFNRLHAKICAIDGHLAFIGGSNIGDHYLNWRDSNLCVAGNLGDAFAQLYTYLRQFSQGNARQRLPLSDLKVDGISLLLTLPGRRQDIRRALLDLILEAERSVTIRTWYFLPDKEILNALCSQAENGIDVTILFSHRTRVPFIDLANRIASHKLRRSGVCVYRYKGRYMHAKEAWNDKGTILFGSANVDKWALNSNFECSLRLHDYCLMQALQQALLADLSHCQPQMTGIWQKKTLPAIASACSFSQT